MKQKLSRFLTLCLLLTLLLLPDRAYAAGASFSGTSSLRAGDKVTVTFSVSGSNIVAIQGTLSYDSNLELTGTSQLIGSPWAMDMNGSTVVLYDNSAGGSPVSSASVFSATFRVKSGVASGTTVSASVNNITVSDGSSDTSLGSASWSATIAAPLSSNARLSSLSCSSGTLSPAFSADTTSYSVTVPYSVTSLSLSYTTENSGAKVSVSGNSLGVGSNTVTLTVTAENGNTKTYTIRATREQDPNYVPSSNARLSSLSVSSGKLSPVFDPEVAEYVLYVPYETEHIDLSGVAADGKARSVAGSSADLEPGDNALTVICTAEDGSTTETYTVHVYRMPAFTGVLPEIIGGDPADYSAVDEALARVPADLTVYTDASAAALQSAVDAVVRDYPAEKQADVDAMAAAIETALDALETKPEPGDEPGNEPKKGPQPASDPEAEPTLWDKLLAVGTENVTIPYVEQLTGPLPLWIPAAVALGLLVLLFYLIGTLIGRAAGKRRTLRRLQKEQEAAVQLDNVIPITPGVAGEETWQLPEDAAAAVAETVDSASAPAERAPDIADAEPAAEEPVPEAPEADVSPVEEPIPEAPEAEAPPAEEIPSSPADPEPASVPEEPASAEPESPVPEVSISDAPGMDVTDDPRYMSLDDLLKDIHDM